MKDTIEVDEPEGLSQSLPSFLTLFYWIYYLRNNFAEVGDPLTAEEVEEKELLLEEASQTIRPYCGLTFVFHGFFII